MTSLAAKIEERWEHLRVSEQSVARYLADDPFAALYCTASDLAERTGTSDATVVRTARALGYSGLPDLKRQASIELTKTVDPSTRLEQAISRAAEAKDESIAAVLHDAVETVQDLRSTVDAEEVVATTKALHQATDVVTWGLGTSATAARYAAERLSRTGVPATHMDRSGFSLANDLINLRASQALLLFVPGRRHDDLTLILSTAREVGATSILVSNSHGPEVRTMADLVVELPHSVAKITTELFTEVLLVDVLVNALLSLHPDAARAARSRLTKYRTALD
ncbi:MurR/RpiR family transcriptional regulator [Brevibacterium sp. FME17]|uniref:MurR/RpiR family transcriptional regulator n=1 Tax=Brevibacterium sp. FME17 TaxID=2742606 RepID=UPI001868E0FF|nr:MurR/RpiR family transcriptional regulator [Brevibacterium sp. FME17]